MIPVKRHFLLIGRGENLLSCRCQNTAEPACGVMQPAFAVSPYCHGSMRSGSCRSASLPAKTSPAVQRRTTAFEKWFCLQYVEPLALTCFSMIFAAVPASLAGPASCRQWRLHNPRAIPGNTSSTLPQAWHSARSSFDWSFFVALAWLQCFFDASEWTAWKEHVELVNLRSGFSSAKCIEATGCAGSLQTSLFQAARHRNWKRHPRSHLLPVVSCDSDKTRNCTQIVRPALQF